MEMWDPEAYRDPDNMPAVYKAVWKRDLVLLQQALAENQYVDEAYGTRTPMYILVAGKWHDSNPEILRTLLNHGANPELRAGGGLERGDEHGMPPLFTLAVNHIVRRDNPIGWMQMMVQLLDRNVDLDTRDPYGTCILSYAVERGEIGLVKLMVDRGAYIDIRDWHRGNTPLMQTFHWGFPEIARFLVRRGASVSIEDDECRTALDVARWSTGMYHLGINAKDFALELQNIALEVQASRNLAVAMGLHPRLGGKSLLQQIDPEMLHMLLHG